MRPRMFGACWLVLMLWRELVAAGAAAGAASCASASDDSSAADSVKPNAAPRRSFRYADHVAGRVLQRLTA